MRPRVLALAGLLLAALALGGYLLYQAGLEPVALADGKDLFLPGSPGFEEDQARVEAVMPPGPRTEAFLATQAALAVLAERPGGALSGQLITALEASRHGRRWRLTVRPGWKLQEGGLLDAGRLASALGPLAAPLGGSARVVDAATVDLVFKARPAGLPGLLAQWRVPGTGPFRREGNTLVRFDGFTPGRAGFAAVTVRMEPEALEGHAWAEGLATGRWAWALYPGSGKVAPEDMARVRLAPYDELRMKDGTVWFLSRRLRRVRPDPEDWSRTRLFGAWKGAMDLPYDPLGL